jgi:hypothetical protein
MKLESDTDIVDFNPEQQDALLAEMQRDALRVFRSAVTIADRANATTAFADASRARLELVDFIGERRRSRMLQRRRPG